MPRPRSLLLVRHGESVGNLASARAEREGAERLDLRTRDADTPLSPRGEEQARATGVWFASLPAQERPTAVWSSPYLRARQTASLAVPEGTRVRLDERLRDRELGVLDRLTWRGVQRLHPDEAERRRHLGKFYHRPSGGESWADVALRVRAFLDDVLRAPADGPVLLVTHDAVVMLIRYVLEELTEEDLMDLERGRSVRNASVTRLDASDDGWRVAMFDEVGHLAALDAPVTEHEGTDDRGR
ncbi:histidine phosphatase family protein [Cellulomonas massiliensis]|uniref:histidine phosphatase family protein n=1 Tax=Cellulomonas massiliensis TaxID=1465811 RepID=UPI0003755334|nr:histidine phosphatase family protein [Cellulomonas massiliensis]